MKVEFPDLKGKEQETLYIIGNGFDLHHAVLSRYKHFCCWLCLNGYEDFVDKLQNAFPLLERQMNNYLWSNFEDALGKYDLDALYTRELKQLTYPFTEDEWRKIPQNVSKICSKIRPLMKEWAKHINISQITPILDLNKESRYLTFNYTRVLEEVYQIPPKQVCHIHGSVDDKTELIVGHGLVLSTNDIDAKSDEEEAAKKEVVELMNSLGKKVQQQIEQHHEFFISLKNVSHVVVLGHSLAKIDLPYIGEILKTIQENSHWHFSKYSEKDDEGIQNLVSHPLAKEKIRTYWTFNF